MQNLVKIKIGGSCGSGIIFPIDNSKKTDEQRSYMIITNKHVLSSLSSEHEPKKDDVSSNVELEIHDAAGNKVPESQISEVYFALAKGSEDYDDVGALLLMVNKTVKIESPEVQFGSNEKMQLISKGYPYVFKNDKVNSILTIEGRQEEAMDTQMGIYRIVDDYHWYQGKADKSLLEGMSGGLVYINDRFSEKIIGMNQSLCNIEGGMNPFKFVYYIPIQHVFEVLRDNGIILYEYAGNQIQLVWNHDKKAEKDMDIMVIGNSGSGKSSFVKTLCRNGNLLDSNDDGQTTRMTIKYTLSPFCEEPKVEIKFQNQDAFCKRMEKYLDMELARFIFSNKYKLERLDIHKESKAYLNYIYPFLETMKFGKNYDDKLKKLQESIKRVTSGLIATRQSDDEILKCYQEVFALFETLENEKVFSREKLGEYLNQEKFRKFYNRNFSCDKNIENYFHHILSAESDMLFDDTELKENFLNTINHFDGYFDIKEFFFLDKEMQIKIEEKQRELFYPTGMFEMNWCSLERVKASGEAITEENKPDKLEDIRINLYKKIKEYYEGVYKLAMQYLHNSIKVDKNSISESFESLKVNSALRDIVIRCMKLEKQDSLTSLIENIHIEDSISNEYAYWFYNKNIRKLSFYDTCGLDHINRGEGLENYVGKIFSDLADKGQKTFDAIFYIKKMDSGKPTELTNIIPVIYNLQPSVPVYCIFTGADHFFEGKEIYLDRFGWNKDTYKNKDNYAVKMFPKAVSRMYEDKEIVDNMNCPLGLKNKLYDIIVENIVPFLSECETVNDVFLNVNRRSLRKIFTSILIDEWNGGFIDVTRFKMLNDDSEEYTKLRDAIREDLKRMFQLASETKWEYRHYKTIDANFRRVFRCAEKLDYNNRNPELGYNGTYLDRWGRYLQEGFQQAFISPGSMTFKILHQMGVTESKVFAIMAKVRNIILLTEMNTWKNDSPNDFRKQFEEMYDEKKGIYKFNPFAYHDREFVEKTNSIEALNDVCDFYKAVETHKEILEAYTKIFMDRVIEIIKAENGRCIKLLIEYKEDFGDQVLQMKKFLDKYVKNDTGTEGDAKIYEKQIEELVKIIMTV